MDFWNFLIPLERANSRKDSDAPAKGKLAEPPRPLAKAAPGAKPDKKTDSPPKR